MKGYKLLVSFFVTGSLLVGCQSTSDNIISSDNNLVKYKSRCMLHDAAQVDAFEKKGGNVLLSMKAPKYPMKAVRAKIEGYAKMEFDISSEGKPININVIESSPKGLFNSAAKTALSAWKYEAREGFCQMVQLDFALG
ncbi:MAG: energy transducer TonB [Colwellia sp.]|nr:energy transducer TonB [Colwellia sp.]